MTTPRKPTQKALLAAVRANPELLPRLLLVAEQVEGYGSAVTLPRRAHLALAPLLDGHRTERLAVLGLNRRRQVTASEVLTVGSSAFTIVCPRQIMRWALLNDAHAIILGHNHPSGSLEPSGADKDVTNRVARAGRAVGIPLLDHLIISAGDFLSMADRGLVPFGGDL